MSYGLTVRMSLTSNSTRTLVVLPAAVLAEQAISRRPLRLRWLPVMLAGFGARTEPATSVHDDLECRAMYVAGDGTEVVLLVCDLLNMSAEFADAVRDAVGDALGLGRPNVLTACTHTHSGPNALAGGERIGWPTPDGYLDILVRGCVDAAVAARDGAVDDVSMRFARAALPDHVSYNRRDLPYAPTFAVLDVLDSDGARVGTVANVSIHPVAMGPKCLSVSADWPGAFRAEFEARAGGAAVLLSGPLGDVNPEVPHIHPQETWGSWDDAARVGRDVAEIVAAVVNRADAAGAGVAVTRHREIDLPVGETLLSSLAGQRGALGVELVEWRLGDVDVVSVPGEAFCEFGDQVIASRANPVLIAGLAPVWLGYLPVPFREGYEEGLSYGDVFVQALLQALTAS